MRLYLMQHGRATTKDEDPDRPLTGKGREEVRAVAERIGVSRVGEIGRVVHSGKHRARQSAEIVVEVLGRLEGEPSLEESDELGPTDDPDGWAGRLRSTAAELGERGLMLVGHLPYMERMAARLVVGDPEESVIRFRKGGVVCLEHGEKGKGGWEVAWYLTPPLA